MRDLRWSDRSRVFMHLKDDCSVWGLVALTTAVRFIPSVNFLMNCKCTFMCKIFVAVAVAVCHLPNVCFLMSWEFRFLYEILVAVAATVWLLPSVCSLSCKTLSN